jgi:twitching motility protein PilT
MQTMDNALMDLVTKGLVTKAEAQGRSMNPNLFGPTGSAAGAA